MGSAFVAAEVAGPRLEAATGAALLLSEQQSLSRKTSSKTGIKSIDAHFPELIRNAMLQSLAAAPSTPTPGASLRAEIEIFILAPPTSTVISDFHARLQSQIVSTEEQSIQLLENIKLLQYFDVAGLAEGLSEISQTFHEHESTSKRPSVLLIQGLSGTLTSAQRRSGALPVAATASNLLRRVIHLSRSYPELLVLVEIDVEVVTKSNKGEGAALDSAFAGENGEAMVIAPSGTVGEILEYGLDVIVAVHDGFGKASKAKRTGPGAITRIVEVTQDRGGNRKGEWCLWVQ